MGNHAGFDTKLVLKDAWEKWEKETKRHQHDI